MPWAESARKKWLAGGWVGNLVVAGGAAGFAVHEAIGAEAYLELGLAQHTVFFAPAMLFHLLALGADDAA